MPKYRYVALNSQGREISGRLAAETMDQARELLGKRQYRIQDIYEERPWGQNLERWLARFQPVSFIELAFTTRQMALMVKAGVPITRCLEFVSNQPLGGKLQKAWSDCERQVREGQSFSKSLSRHPEVFSDYYVGMLYAGETAGTFADCLDSVSNYLEKEAKTRARIRAAVTYPIAILVIGMLLTIAITQWVLPPLLNSLFKDTGLTLPWPTQLLMTITDLTSRPGVAVGTLAVGLVLGITGLRYFQSSAGRERLQVWILATPVLRTLLGKILACRFCRSFASLMRVGVPLTRSLQVCSLVLASNIMRTHFERIEASLMEGGKLHDGIRAIDFFPTLTASFMELGEDTGRIPESLDRLADMLDEELTADLDAFTAMLEPMAMMAMGSFVLFVVLAVFLPLNSMLSNMG